MFVGEIGLPRREFLYDIKFWEVRRILRGYRRRERTFCIITRRQAFWNAKCSMADSSKIHTPSDLWPLPWDNEDDDIPPPISEQERQELTDLIASENARLESEQKRAGPE